MAHPLLSLSRSLEKFAYFFSPVPLPLGSGDLEYAEGRVVVRNYRGRNQFVMIWSTIYSIALFGGIVMFIRKRWGTFALEEYRYLVILAVITAVTLLPVLITFAESRFRLPLEPLLLPLAASGSRALLSSKDKLPTLTLIKPPEWEER